MVSPVCGFVGISISVVAAVVTAVSCIIGSGGGEVFISAVACVAGAVCSITGSGGGGGGVGISGVEIASVAAEGVTSQVICSISALQLACISLMPLRTPSFVS